jgi:aryl-phospho-beta-D-glucosidase BglC (GH1 family)
LSTFSAQPPLYQYAHFSTEGANLYRIPFAWQLATPTLGGALNMTFWEQYDQNVQAALETYAYVIVDVHNYARWNGEIINQVRPLLLAKPG